MDGGGRLRVLGHPVTTGSACLLAVNDQLLKARVPGFVTGKLSDVAGVVLVAVLASAAVGRRAGIATVAVGFTLLKTWPGVAELAAPVLGGVTRRDPTDLVALVALVPLWWWTGRRLPPARSELGRDRIGVAGTTLALASVAVAMLATSATSCLDDAGVDAVAVAADGTLIAVADDGVTWVSTDGRRWEPADDDVKGGVAPREEACLPDGRCFRIDPDRALRACPDGINCVVVVGWSTDQRERLRAIQQGACAIEYGYHAVAAGRGATGGTVVVVAMGEQGVLVGDGERSWEAVAVGPYRPPDLGRLPGWTARLVWLAPLLLAVAAPFAGMAIGRRRGGAGGVAAGVWLVGFALLSLVVGMVLAGFFATDGRAVGVGVALASIVVFVASLALARGERAVNR